MTWSFAAKDIYSGLVFLALVASAIYWSRKSKGDEKLLAVFLGAIGFGFSGAAVLYFLCEGSIHAPLREIVAGKSVIGGLLGGYFGVELVKKLVGYRKPTGDRFAAVLPLALALGRVGCIFAECCPGIEMDLGPFSLVDSQGIPRWPAPIVEIGFNLLMALLFYHWRRRGKFSHQHFNIYLVAYGGFRFFHEFLRASAQIYPGYQITALCLTAIGAAAFLKRRSSALIS